MTKMEDFSSGSVFELIQINYSKMSRQRRKIADYIMDHASEAVQESISSIALNAGVKSESSIVRFYRMLGYDTFSEFKIHLAQNLVGSTFFHSSEDLNMKDSASEIRRKFISSSVSSLNDFMQQQNDEPFEKAVDLILKAKRVILIGYAASAAICYYAYFRLLELGINCYFSSDSHINAAMLAQFGPEDLIICVSVSGETADIVRQLSSKSQKTGTIISLTSFPESTIATLSDVVLSCKTQESSMVTDAMNARLLQLCIVDILYSILCTRIGEEAIIRLSKTRRVFRDYKYIAPHGDS